jgi:DNA-binding NarL/FixJ family response regulator
VSLELPFRPIFFTPREYQIITLMGQEGLANKDIARRLGMTTESLKVRNYKLFKKLGMHSRAEVIIWYWRAGKRWMDDMAAAQALIQRGQ